MHTVLFNRAGKKTEIKKNIRKWSGVVTEDEDELEEIKEKVRCCDEKIKDKKRKEKLKCEFHPNSNFPTNALCKLKFTDGDKAVQAER